MAASLKTRTPPGRPQAGPALLAGLLVAAGYAAFAEGAAGQPEGAWLQGLVALLAVLAAAAWLGAGRLRPGASPVAVAGVVLLGLLAGWTVLSLAWSVAPDR